jgi:hypothetical protein
VAFRAFGSAPTHQIELHPNEGGRKGERK